MLHAYIDEAGIHEGAKICCVAGYFGGVNQWKRFERQWKRIIDREGIEEFHAKQFWGKDKNGNRVGPYKRWDDRRAAKFQNDLVEVIRGCRIFPFSAAVVTDDWKVLPEDERRWLTGAFLQGGKYKTTGAPNKPYYLPFGFCIQTAARYCKPGLRIDYSFDLNNAYRGYSTTYYAYMKQWNIYREYLGEIAFPTSKDALPLQAADLLAFHSCRYSVKALKGQNPLHRNSVLGKIVERTRDKQNDSKLFNRFGLDLELENYRESKGASNAQNPKADPT
jgi:hypothetical protein